MIPPPIATPCFSSTPSTAASDPTPAPRLLARLPMRNSLIRVFTLDEGNAPALREAAE